MANRNSLLPSINIWKNIDGTTATQPEGTNNTTIANTEFVQTAISPIVWAPNGTGTATTFEEVYEQLLTKPEGSTIYLNRNSLLEPELTIPSGIWELRNFSISTFVYGDPTINNIRILDGAIIQNLGVTFKSCSITFLSNSPSLQYDIILGVPVIFFGLASVVNNDGTSPVYIIPENTFAVLALPGGTIINGLNSQSIISLETNSACIVRLQDGGNIDTETISGPVGSTVIFQHDGSCKFSVNGFTLPNFLGTLINQPLGLAGGAGPTSFRPDTTDPSNLPSVGCNYFDVTLGYPIYWTGAIWVDSTGTPV